MSSTTWELKEESELRCEVPPDCRLRVRLVEKKGYAEIFGIEMSSVRDYFFTDENVAIFTWYVILFRSSFFFLSLHYPLDTTTSCAITLPLIGMDAQ